MKLIYTGLPAYHPATGLQLHPGEHDYPDEHAEALLRLGLTEPEGQKGRTRKAAKEA